MTLTLKNTMMKNSVVSNHLSSRSKRHSGVYTVTPTPRAAAETPAQSKRESPFGAIVMGEGAGTPPTAYQPILLRF